MNSKIKLYVLLAVVAVLSVAAPVFAQVGATPFDWVVAKQLTVQNAAEVVTGNLTVTAGDISGGDDLTVADDAAITDDLTVAGDLTLTPGTAETIEYAGQIDPTGSYHQITASAARGTSSIADGTAGDVLTLINVGSNTITITDTGTLKLAGNVALGQYDAVTLYSDGTNWVQISTSNN